jgi:hypothetical protein
MQSASTIPEYLPLNRFARLAAHRDDGRRFIVRADKMLTAFVELEAAPETGLVSRHELGLVRSQRPPEICSAKRRLHEKTESVLVRFDSMP